MKILWVKTDFLHPTDRGGQIRTLETLRRLHLNNEVHYVAYNNPAEAEGLQRASEYCSQAYPVNRPVPKRGSPGFIYQFGINLFSDLPLAVGRYQSAEMQSVLRSLVARHNFDSIVCDFLSVAPNIPDLRRSVLFQHNVETMIWRRHAEHATDPLRRRYFRMQAERMFACERAACRAAAHVIAVSRKDADQMRTLFNAERVTDISTGVDLDYFKRPASTKLQHDLVFVGAMDWLPNIDGVRYFVSEILPLIRKKLPDCSLVIAGRSPVPEVLGIAEKDARIQVTGTVPDVRPYLWNSAVSIVPLRIGGGTRLKIYEAMAAGVPVVATSIGAEGLDVSAGRDISLANDPAAFAERCLVLLGEEPIRTTQADAALQLVTQRFSWGTVAEQFEGILQQAACPV